MGHAARRTQVETAGSTGTATPSSDCPVPVGVGEIPAVVLTRIQHTEV